MRMRKDKELCLVRDLSVVRGEEAHRRQKQRQDIEQQGNNSAYTYTGADTEGYDNGADDTAQTCSDILDLGFSVEYTE